MGWATSKVMKRNERLNTIQIGPRQDLWSNALLVRPQRRPSLNSVITSNIILKYSVQRYCTHVKNSCTVTSIIPVKSDIKYLPFRFVLRITAVELGQRRYTLLEGIKDQGLSQITGHNWEHSDFVGFMNLENLCQYKQYH